MRLINDLIADAKEGRMTIEEAVREALPYALENYMPKEGEGEVYNKMFQLFKATSEKAEPTPPVIRPAGIPRMEGQLWEPCKCGKEPVYMPLHLCPRCWPKQSNQ